MKRLLKQFTHDAYNDWFVLVVMTGVGIVLFAIGGAVEFYKVSTLENEQVRTATSTIKMVDVKKLQSLVEIYEERKVQFEQGGLPKVDVADPSV